MRDAVSLLDQLISVGAGKITVDDVARVLGIPDVDVFFAITDAIGGSDSSATLAALEAAIAAGFDPRDLIDGLVEHLRNLLLVRAAPDPGRLVGRISDYEKHEGASSSIAEDDLVRLLRIGIEAQASVKWSTQPALIVEVALVRMAKMTSSVAIVDVVKALESGSDSGRSGPPAGGAGSGVGGNLRKSARAQSAGGAVEPTAGGGGSSGAQAAEGTATAASASVVSQPASAAATAVAEQPAGSVEPSQWPDVLEKIRGQKPALAAFLNDAVPSCGDGAVLELKVPNGSRFHKDQLQDRGNMRLMERAAGEIFGGRVKLAFRFGEAPSDRGSSRRSECPVSKETADDPVVKKVLDMFGGELRGAHREE